jgi:nicotinamidase-related amidase
MMTLAPQVIQPDAVFHKRKHSALIGTGLDVWLTQQGIRRLIISGIRTEQCCGTTARHTADQGWTIDYVTEATQTFAMTDAAGRTHSPEEIKAHTCTAGRAIRPHRLGRTGAGRVTGTQTDIAVSVDGGQAVMARPVR